ncbi:MAG: class I SAM-dependent methyltransferase [Candidatus Doudnabacteria bacterium]|nr:class I SAM-dependent methyltransferase [Candidatus Doudnabacteria bacterium]
MESLVFDPQIKFLSPDKVLFATGLTVSQTVADLGTGSGFYAVAAAKIVGETGNVLVVDILESALEHVSAEARLKFLRNIKTLRCDLEKPKSCLKIPDGSVDLVIMGNILHQIGSKDNLMTEAYRLLKTGGKLLLIDWNQKPSTIGPPAKARISSEQARQLVLKFNFKLSREVDTDNYHYGMVFVK